MCVINDYIRCMYHTHTHTHTHTQGSSYFQRTDFDGDGNGDGIQFGIQDIVVEQQPATTGFFSSEFIGVQAFLNQHSTENWSEYCLSYRFTSRDFNDGVVGLAYIAPQPGVNAAGGLNH